MILDQVRCALERTRIQGELDAVGGRHHRAGRGIFGRAALPRDNRNQGQTSKHAENLADVLLLLRRPDNAAAQLGRGLAIPARDFLGHVEHGLRLVLRFDPSHGGNDRGSRIVVRDVQDTDLADHFVAPGHDHDHPFGNAILSAAVEQHLVRSDGVEDSRFGDDVVNHAPDSHISGVVDGLHNEHVIVAREVLDRARRAAHNGAVHRFAGSAVEHLHFKLDSRLPGLVSEADLPDFTDNHCVDREFFSKPKHTGSRQRVAQVEVGHRLPRALQCLDGELLGLGQLHDHRVGREAGDHRITILAYVGEVENRDVSRGCLGLRHYD